MLSRDYISRLIEEFARFLAAIAGLRKDGEPDKALKKIDEVYDGVIGLEGKVIRSVDSSQLLDLLLVEKQFDNNYLKMIADLLYEEGLIYRDLSDPVSLRNVFEKASVLIRHLMESDSTFSFDWYEKLAIIDEALNA